MRVRHWSIWPRSASVLLCALAVTSSGLVLADGFTVTPVRIYMTPKDRAVAITVTNDGDNELVMQADLFQWKQTPEGQDDLIPTEEMFLAPPIVKIPAKSRQVVRLARISREMPSEQLTYRMIVREIPEARKPTGDSSEVQFALAFNMPVFITSPQAKPKLDCTIARATANAVKAVCANTGTAHIHPVKLELSDRSGQVLAHDDNGGYILSSITRSYELNRQDAKIPGGPGKLAVSLADGTVQDFDVNIAD